jgi:hypothetical protein
MRQFLILVFLSNILASCEIQFEKNYYERISGIKFPAKYKVLETFDNGQFLTATVFEIDSLTLLKFIKENNFDTLRNLGDLTMFSESVLKKYKPAFTTTTNIFVIRKSKDKNHWNYVVDFNQRKLWAEISYPDWNGD